MTTSTEFELALKAWAASPDSADAKACAFEVALHHWQDAEHAAMGAMLSYEHAYAMALLTATGKSAEQRKAEADLAAEDARFTFESARIKARAARYKLEWLGARREEG